MKRIDPMLVAIWAMGAMVVINTANVIYLIVTAGE